MEILDIIYNSLKENTNLTPAIRNDLFELIVIFHNKFPKVSLDNLNNRLKTIKIDKSSKYVNSNVSHYDFRNNILYFNIKEIKKEYDAKHVLMYEILNIISSNKYQLGFNTDNRFEALNVGYTEMMANFLVGNNNEKMLYPDEAILANMISTIVGPENMFTAYFNNDSKKLLNDLVKVGVNL